MVTTTLAQNVQELKAKAQQLVSEQKYREAAAVLKAIAEQDPDSPANWFFLAYAYHMAEDYDLALQTYEKTKTVRSYAQTTYYNIACIHASRNQIDQALEALETAYSLGYNNIEHMRTDPDIENLRADPRFRLPDEITFREFTHGGRTIKYTTVLPQDYDPAKTYPSLLAFSPGGQDQAAVHWAASKYWGQQASSAGWLVISPTAPEGGWYVPRNTRLLGHFLDFITAEHKLEQGQLHLAGCSNGGVTALHMAVAFPERFSTLTVLPGYARNQQTLDKLDRLGDIKVTIFHGANDRAWWIEQMQQTKAYLDKFKIETTLHVFPNDGSVVQELYTDGLMEHLEKLRDYQKEVSP